MSWTDGYITDVRYPAFFYKEMQPLWLSALAGFGGFSAPDPGRPFALCELGCGAAINLLVAAACHPDAQIVGVDFNEDHLRIARDAARSSGLTNIEFIHADFATFARSNRQHFDFVTSHGVWSWIAPEQQAALLDGAAAALKSGGLLFLHYMSHPGSTDLLPLQHLLNLCAHHMPGPSPRKARTGMTLLQQLADNGLFADRPGMLKHLANMAKRHASDLAHEFLTDHWRPQHCADVHQQASRSGLSFIGSADAFATLDISLSIPRRMQGLIRQTRAPALAETLKDMARNAHLRMDLFQKDPVALDRKALIARLAETRFGLLPGAPDHGPVHFSTPIGPVTGPEEVFTPLLQRLGDGEATGAELLGSAAFSGDVGGLLQSLQLLMMAEIAHPMKGTGPDDHDRARHLSNWFAHNDVALTLLPRYATAVRPLTAD